MPTHRKSYCMLYCLDYFQTYSKTYCCLAEGLYIQWIQICIWYSIWTCIWWDLFVSPKIRDTMDHRLHVSAERFLVVDLQTTFLFTAFSNLAGAFLWLRPHRLFLQVDLKCLKHLTIVVQAAFLLQLGKCIYMAEVSPPPFFFGSPRIKIAPKMVAILCKPSTV